MSKLKSTIVGLGMATTLSANPKEAPNQAVDNIPDKYKTTITLTNDSTTMVGSESAAYNQSDDRIYIHKGDITWDDFGFKNTPTEKDPTLTIVHERQHQINAHKGVGQANMSLEENYQRDVHNEITALIAEKLEIRRQYKACKNDAERQAFFQKFAKDADNAAYIQAIKSGRIDPNSTQKQDFLKEMAFIKDSSIRYRADPTDDGYKKNWTEHAYIFLMQRGDAVKPNPEALKKEVQAMYNIGGFDFNTVGNKAIHVIENQSIFAADNMLQQGAKPEKIIRFMQQGEGEFKLAETLDVSGLNREQAEKVMQTAFVTQYLAKDIAGDIAMGQEPNYDYGFIASYNRNKIATYLDLKSDIWEKNGTLTEQGDEAKFNELMKKAKEIQLDPEGWLNEVQDILTLAKDPSRAAEYEALKARVKELQGKKVNFDEAVANLDEYKLPLDGTSKEEILKAMAQKEAEDAAFAKEYNEKHPEKKRLSDPYQVSIMDLNSDILKDELKQIEEAERHVEPLYTGTKPKTYAPIGDGRMMEVPTPQYQKAEIKTTVNDETGATTEVAMIDGKKHGAEILKDKDGNIIGYKLYDHGKELDVNKHKVELTSTTDANGMTYTGIKLDGQKFGAEIVSDNNGKTKAAFYEQNGVLMEAKVTAKIEKTEEHINTKQQLHEDLYAQTEELPPNPKATSQELRFDMHWKRRQNNTEANLDTHKDANTVPLQKEEKENSNITPIWQHKQNQGNT